MKIYSIYPGNFYINRKIKVFDNNNKMIGYLHPNSLSEIHTNSKKLLFKLDYHKRKISNIDINDNLIVYFRFRPYFPFNYLDLMKNSLVVERVDSKKFDERIKELKNGYKLETLQLNLKTYLILLLQILISFVIVISCILFPDLIKNDLNFIFLLSFFSFFSLIISLFNLKRINQKEFNIRYISSIFLFAGLAFFTKENLSILMVLLTSLLALIYFLPDKLSLIKIMKNRF